MLGTSHTVEINSGVHLLKSWIREVPLLTSGGLGLKNLVLFTSMPSTVKISILFCQWHSLSVAGLRIWNALTQHFTDSLPVSSIALRCWLDYTVHHPRGRWAQCPRSVMPSFQIWPTWSLISVPCLWRRSTYNCGVGWGGGTALARCYKRVLNMLRKYLCCNHPSIHPCIY